MLELGHYDYVIVGAGTAGCLLANRLSADPKNRVLLLEAGGKDRNPWIHVPVGYLYTQGNPSTDWCFKLEPEAGLGGRVLNYPRGKVLGGCSSINGMIYMRGQAADYDHWRQLGNVGWGWDDVLPYFLHHEDNQAARDGEHHRAGGEWRIEKQRLSWDILDDWRTAAAEFGIAQVDNFNTGENAGSDYFHVNQRRGVRWSAAKAFLRPAQSRSNLEVVTNAHSTKIEFDNSNKATALMLTVEGRDARVQIDGELVLAAGAIGSPHLLQLSGVGEPQALKAAGIQLQIDSPGVGGNLQDHLQLRTIYKLQGKPKTLNGMMGPIGKLKMGIEYALNQSGPLSMAPSQLGAFAKSDPSLATPDLQYHIQPLSLDKFGEPLHPFPAMTASVCNLRPESRGTVRPRNANPFEAPAIQPHYLATDRDRRTAARAIALTRRIMLESQGMAKYAPEEYLPGLAARTEDELAEAAGRIGTTIFHPVGTCKMGTDPAAVVDPQLRLRGAQNVRVADASVMPTITSGNTNSPTLMIAEKAAAMILRE